MPARPARRQHPVPDQEDLGVPLVPTRSCSQPSGSARGRRPRSDTQREPAMSQSVTSQGSVVTRDPSIGAYPGLLCHTTSSRRSGRMSRDRSTPMFTGHADGRTVAGDSESWRGPTGSTLGLGHFSRVRGHAGQNAGSPIRRASFDTASAANAPPRSAGIASRGGDGVHGVVGS
jgi:hypothetical protein